VVITRETILKINNNFAGEVLAEVTRDGVVESMHLGHLVALNADGSVFISAGSPELPIFPRSAIKAIQAAAMLRAGLIVDDQKLALICASHSGAKVHIDLTKKILADAGIAESAMRNAIDKPLGEKEKISWGDKAGTQFTQNCSGKHAGMLVTCQINGWDMENYLAKDHPLQLAIKKELEEMAEEKISTVSVDGCGAPLFAISTMGLAKAIRKVVISKDPIYQQIVKAATSYPELIAGDGRLTTRMMKSVPGLFMKEGAEGIEVCALSDGRTIAMKIIDGSWRPVATIIQSIFDKWGVAMPDESVKIYGGPSVVGTVISKI
jgi:L-asparaginase II